MDKCKTTDGTGNPSGEYSMQALENYKLNGYSYYIDEKTVINPTTDVTTIVTENSIDIIFSNVDNGYFLATTGVGIYPTEYPYGLPTCCVAFGPGCVVVRGGCGIDSWSTCIATDGYGERIMTLPLCPVVELRGKIPEKIENL